MRKRKLQLAVMAGVLALAAQSHAALFDISLAGGGVPGASQIGTAANFGVESYQAMSESFQANALQLTVSAPEPAETATLAGVAALGLLFVAFRRKPSTAA
jgi:hypothetical protein